MLGMLSAQAALLSVVANIFACCPPGARTAFLGWSTVYCRVCRLRMQTRTQHPLALAVALLPIHALAPPSSRLWPLEPACRQDAIMLLDEVHSTGVPVAVCSPFHSPRPSNIPCPRNCVFLLMPYTVAYMLEHLHT